MSNKLQAGWAGFNIDTYEARAARAQAEAELAAAATIERMLAAGFTEEEIEALMTL